MPDEAKLTDHFFIKVDNTDLPRKAMDDLVEVIVESSLHLPDMFSIHLHDADLHWMDGKPFELGAEVEISAQPTTGGKSQVLFKGEITALEPDFGEGTQASLVVRGYDRSHRLHRGTHSRAYQNVTDSDLATKIAQDAGLRAKVDSTQEIYKHLLQDNQTHMDFLMERARRIGYEFFVEDRTLHFRKPSTSGSPLELEWGKQLETFRPRLTLLEQVDDVAVKGWNAKTQQVIVGKATRGQAEPKRGQQPTGAKSANEAFKKAERVVVNRVLNSQAEADALAQAVLDEISGAFIEAEGVCHGLPDLRAGRMLKLTALGQRFSGEYLVTAAAHIYRPSGYTVAFNIHGRRAETLYGLLDQAPEAADNRGQYGTVIGVVTNNNDKDDLGRVKVKFPWLSDDVESDWARVVAPGAGADRGLFWLPEIDDEVLVAFEHGDINRPFVLGGLWNGQYKPKLASAKAVENGKVHQRAFTSRVGHSLSFIDDGKDEGMVVETKAGHRLTLGDEKKKVVLETKGGLVLTLDDAKKAITITSNGKLILESKTDLNLTSSGNMTLEATGDLNLKGMSVTAEGKTGVNLKTPGVGKVEVSPAKVSINSGALDVM